MVPAAGLEPTKDYSMLAYKASPVPLRQTGIWSRVAESNCVLVGYEPTVRPFHSLAIVDRYFSIYIIIELLFSIVYNYFELNGATNGGRTHVLCLEGRCTSRCTTAALAVSEGVEPSPPA